MHKNPVWLLFLTFLVGAFLWFAGNTGYKVYRYYRLSGSTPAHIHDWTIQEMGSDQFNLCAHYTYMVGEQTFHDDGLCLDRDYRNIEVARRAIETMGERQWIVWYIPSNPGVSVLEKHFPLKLCIYSTMLMGLLGYFAFIGLYVGSVKESLDRS